MLTFGSLFAGIGGFDLGLERAGLICEWQVEIDEFCNRVLKKHWPNVPRFRDIRDCGAHNLPPVDVICGGPPCQPISTAGQRRGKEDDRWLWDESIRVTEELKPTWCIFENPLGLFTIEHGMAFSKTVTDLETQGYEVWPVVLPACGLDAPHRRYRVFIIAHTKIQGLQDGCGREGWQAATERLMRGPERCGWWEIEPGVRRVDDWVPNRVDRIKRLGNAVVPQVVEMIGRAIIASS